MLGQALGTTDIHPVPFTIGGHQVEALNAPLTCAQFHGRQQLHERAITAVEGEKHETAFAVT